MSDYKQS